MAIFANRNEFIIRRWVLSEEKLIPKKARFIIGRSMDMLAEGFFLSGDKKDFAKQMLAARTSIRFPTLEEVKAQETAAQELWKKQQAEVLAKRKANPQLFRITKKKSAKKTEETPVEVFREDNSVTVDLADLVISDKKE